MASASVSTVVTGVNGMLPAPAVILQKNASISSPRSHRNNAPKPKLKFVVRRLPPGITKAEVQAALGDEWKQGLGKVDWVDFRKGKVSTELARHSKPARYFLHLTDVAHVKSLVDHFKQITWVDARNTHKDSVLIGPPHLEQALYPGLPQGRRSKVDNKQGQIDQDPEWQDFLISLTNPVSKSSALEGTEHALQKEEKVTTTPLIEHLREKKAAKDKPSNKANVKHARVDSKDDKSDRSDVKNTGKSGKDTVASPEKLKKPARKDTVKVLSKDSAKSSAVVPAASAQTKENQPPAAVPERKRERGSTAAAKALLQRDLGLAPAKGRRGAKRDTPTDAAPKSLDTSAPTQATAERETSGALPSEKASANTTDSGARGAKRERFSRSDRRAHKAAGPEKRDVAEESTGQTPIKAPTAPTILRKPAAPVQTTAATVAPRIPTGPAASRNQVQSAVTSPIIAPVSPAAPATSRSAFLKHANASQGITEPLIEVALSAFGTIEKVEIDKRKGFAYVEFADVSGLQKAMAASPVTVAQGAVQVLERKDRPPRENRIVPVIQGATVAPSAPRGPRRGNFAPRPRGGRGGAPSGRGRGGHTPTVGVHGQPATSSEPPTAPVAPTSTPATESAT